MNSGDRHQSYLLGDTRDAVYRYRLFNTVHEPATRDRLATLDIAPDGQVLEIGCGIGQTACLFATETVPEGHVVAFDRSPDLIEAARQNAAERGVGNVTFICASAREFDYEPDRFDLAHTRFVLSYMSDAADIVSRVFGAMKPGGIFFGEEIVQSYILVGDTSWYEPFTRWFAPLIEAGGGHPNYGQHQLPTDVLAAGFTDLRATAHWPLQHQSTCAEMVALAVSREMKPKLVELGIASGEEIDTFVDALMAPERNYTVSPAMVAQIIATKP